MFSQRSCSSIEDQRTHTLSLGQQCAQSARRSSMEDQHTYMLSTGWKCVQSAKMELDGGITHSNDPQCVLPARLELDRWLARSQTIRKPTWGGSIGSQTVNRSKISWVSMPAMTVNRLTNCKPPLSMNERNLHCYNSTIAYGNYAPISPTIWRSLNYSNMQDEIVWAEPRCRGSDHNEFQWLFLSIK